MWGNCFHMTLKKIDINAKEYLVLMKRLLNWLDKAIDGFMVLMLLGIVVTVSLQVLFRFVLNISAPWTEETARFMFIYLTYIGSALMIKEKAHIAIEVLVERLPRSIQGVVAVLIQLAIIFLLAILVQGSWIMVTSSTDVSSATMKWLSMSYIYFALFLGSILMIFYSVIRLIEVIREYFLGMAKVSDESR